MAEIYMIRNIINDKRYIGITTQKAIKRIRKHINALRGGSPGLYDAVHKWGKENFVWYILHTNLTLKEAVELEKEYIAKYDTFHNGYNRKKGGWNKRYSVNPNKRKKLDNSDYKHTPLRIYSKYQIPKKEIKYKHYEKYVSSKLSGFDIENELKHKSYSYIELVNSNTRIIIKYTDKIVNYKSQRNKYYEFRISSKKQIKEVDYYVCVAEINLDELHIFIIPRGEINNSGIIRIPYPIKSSGRYKSRWYKYLYSWHLLMN